MYVELGRFLGHVLGSKSLWKDGDLWTAVLLGVGSFWLFAEFPFIQDGISSHLADVLTITSIIFGFVLSSMIFYVQAAGGWSKDHRVQRVAQKIIDWHVWTILCLLGLIVWIVILWATNNQVTCFPVAKRIGHSFLVFLSLYCGFQILNHALTVWWAFTKQDQLGN